MLEYACQRIYRDARITSIYEGTSQLQVVAAIRYVTNGFYSQYIAERQQETVLPQFQALKDKVNAMGERYNACVNKVNELQNQEYQDFVARHLYEMAADIIMGHLILADASKDADLFGKSAKVYVNFIASEIEKHASFVESTSVEDLEAYRKAQNTEVNA